MYHAVSHRLITTDRDFSVLDKDVQHSEETNEHIMISEDVGMDEGSILCVLDRFLKMIHCRRYFPLVR